MPALFIVNSVFVAAGTGDEIKFTMIENLCYKTDTVTNATGHVSEEHSLIEFGAPCPNMCGNNSLDGSYPNDFNECKACVEVNANPVLKNGHCFAGKCVRSCIGDRLFECEACTVSAAENCIGGTLSNKFIGKCKEGSCVISCEDAKNCQGCNMPETLGNKCKMGEMADLGRCDGSGKCTFACPDSLDGKCDDCGQSTLEFEPCSYHESTTSSNTARMLSGVCSTTGFCVMDCKENLIGSIHDNTTPTCTACSSGKQCMAKDNVIGKCTHGQCVIDCSAQYKPGDGLLCEGTSGCDQVNTGSYCVTHEGKEIGVCDDTGRKPDGSTSHTCIVSCKITDPNELYFRCHSCAAQNYRCYTGIYYGKYDASRAMCVMDCTSSTCTDPACVQQCNTCGTTTGCYSTTSIDSVPLYTPSENGGISTTSTGNETEAYETEVLPMSSDGSCTVAGECSANQDCVEGVCVCKEGYVLTNQICIAKKGIKMPSLFILIPAILAFLLCVMLLAALCLFSGKPKRRNRDARRRALPGLPGNNTSNHAYAAYNRAVRKSTRQDSTGTANPTRPQFAYRNPANRRDMSNTSNQMYAHTPARVVR